VTLDQAVALELAQRRAEHPARDAVDLAQELVEAARPGGEAREDHHAPLGREHAHRCLQGLEVVLVGDPGGGGGLGAHVGLDMSAPEIVCHEF
jgi:hypothetical protein